MRTIFIASISLSVILTSCGGSKNDVNENSDKLVNQISAGTDFLCGVTINGRAKCQGQNTFGQLGNGSSANALESIAVANISNVSLVSSSLFNTCFISNNSAFCTGYNRFGQLGNGTNVDSSVPVKVSNISNVSHISVGTNGYVCAISQNNVYCWGSLSDHSNPLSYKDSNVPVLIGENFRSVSVGATNACAVTLNNEVYCWQNIDKAASKVKNLNKIMNVVTSGIGSCALDSSGNAYCWGDNRYGQLGNGTNVDSNVPVKVSNISNFNSIHTTGLNACGTTNEGNVYCWGLGQSGQLGNGKSIDSRVPVRTNSSENFKQITGSQYAFFGLNKNGNVFAWGAWNLNGLTPTINTTPVKINF